MEVWLNTDEEDDSVSSLMMVRYASSLVSSDPSQWKWVVIALHNSLQGFMVMSLRNSNNLHVMTPKSANKYYKACIDNTPLSEEQLRLCSCSALYEKVKNDEHMKLFTKQLPQSDDNDCCVEKLNNFRNDFIHFQPKNWTIEVSRFPFICLTVIGIIRFLCCESGKVNWYNLELKEKAQVILSECEENLSKIKTTYETNS
jgi:hypothetical protein